MWWLRVRTARTFVHAALALFFLACGSASADPVLNLSVSPGGAPQTFVARLMIDGAIDMSSGQIAIKFDPTVLQVTEVDPGAFITNDIASDPTLGVFGFSVNTATCYPTCTSPKDFPPIGPADPNDPTASGQVGFLLNNPSSGSGDLLDTFFQVLPGAPAGPTPIALGLDINGGPLGGPGGATLLSPVANASVSSTVPEPSTGWLIGLCLALATMLRRRRPVDASGRAVA